MLFIFSSYVLDTGRRELRREESVLSVQPQVFDLLEYLIRNRGRVVSKDDMLKAVWGGRIVSESTLATRINAARGAIGDDGESQHLIRTLSRKGVRFVGEVREAEDEPQPPRADPSPSGPGARAASWVEPERRQLTVMSCDFSGVRELAIRLDLNLVFFQPVGVVVGRRVSVAAVTDKGHKRSFPAFRHHARSNPAEAEEVRAG